MVAHGDRDRSSTSTGEEQGRAPVVPDWSVVTSPAARNALEDVLVAGRWDWRRGGMQPLSGRVLAAVLRLYALYGRPPELSAEIRLQEAATREALDHLARHDLILLAADRESISGAYPFTEKATGHMVTFDRTGRSLNTMCAIDALGAGAMCREDVTIRSRCPLCGKEIVGKTDGDGLTLRDIRPLDAVVWVGLRPSCGCAADTLCTELLLFCDEDHLARWRSRDRGAQGHVLTADEGFQVAKALFIDRALMGPA